MEPLRAQQLFVHYSTQQGLPDNSVRCFAKDKDGFLWIGTHSGLSRFDGKNFTNFYSDPLDSNSIGSNLISSISSDREGNLWVGTDNTGLSILERKTGKFKRFIHIPTDSTSLPGNHVSEVFSDNLGNMWVGCFGKGLARFNEETESFTLYSFDTRTDGYNFNEIKGFVVDPKGKFWLTTRVGIICFDPLNGKHTKLQQDGGWERNGYANITRGADGKIYTGSWDQGIYCFNPADSSWSEYLIKPGGDYAYNQVADLMFIDAETILFTTFWEGFGMLNIHTGKVELLHDKYPGNEVIKKDEIQSGTVIFKSGNGFYLGTSGGFIYMAEALPGLKNYDGSTYRSKFQAPGIAVVSSVIAPKGDPFIYSGSYYRAGLYAFNREGGEVVRNIAYPDERNSNNVNEIIKNEFSDNSWLVATTEGLLEFNPLRGTMIPAFENKIFEGWVESVCFDKTGLLWVISGRGVYSWKPNSEPVNHTSDIIKSVKINDFHPLMLSAGEDGRIWIRTNQRDLIGFSPDIKNSIIISQRLEGGFSPGGEVEQAIPLADSTLWLNIANLGIAKINPNTNKIQFTGRSRGLSGTRIGCMNTDLSGNLWMIHENGISVLIAESGLVRNFGSDYGLVFKTPNFIGPGDDGLMYAGGEDRLVGFHPEALLKDFGGGVIYITEIKLFNNDFNANKTANIIDSLNLNYDENYLSFAFTVPDINTRSDFYYYSLLSGFDKDWVSCGTKGEVNYSGLPPGKYELNLRAKNASGAWCSPAKKIVLIINPPFWKTWWFRISVILIVLFCIYLIYRFRVKQIERKAREENLLAEKMRELENMALRSQMNPHFIFNCLNSINSYIVKSKPDEASMYVTKFSRLIRLILDNSRSASIPLEKELTALKLYIDMENLRFNNRLNYEIIAEPGLDWVPVPPMIIQPFVENAIWHGLLHSNNPGYIKINISAEGEFLICKITDNGIGRKAAAELKSKSSLKNKSLGMQVTKSRIKSYNLSDEEGENPEIRDVVDENGEAAGTEVILKIRIYHGTGE
ncbi:MAG: histidine kinase [Bacteroidia bacterium]